ncbi:MAG: DUF5752 family protein [Candidatus Bathyarchaeota archaeon]|nr:DUF5752 family protein [Candidatus Bathyarchaeota archaeon]
MSLSPIKLEILQSMLLSDKPQKAMEIAKDAHREFQPVMMHLLGLQRMGYVSSPEKGLYIISSAGKKVLGIPEITKEKATAILAYAPHDKSFHFYATVGKPLSMHAHNLRDFVGKIDKADIISVEFHFKRGDFESWFKGLGDEELAKKTALLKQRNVVGEELRKQLREMTHKRYHELAELTGQVFPEDEHNNHLAPHGGHTHIHA